jgi:hypothetical protein
MELKQLQFVNGVAGDGFYCDRQCTVEGVLKFKITEPGYEYDGFAEGRFYHENIGSIYYTDTLFIKDIQQNLKQLGFKHWQGIGYSESGMQADHYVSMDATYELAREAIERGYDVSLPSDQSSKTKGEEWYASEEGFCAAATKEMLQSKKLVQKTRNELLEDIIKQLESMIEKF